MYKDFNVYKSKILEELSFISPDIFEDKRGILYTAFLKNEIEKLLPNNLNFIHDKFAFSKKDVIRGIHGDFNSWKLVTCVSGKVFQVIVDNRVESKNYLKYDSLILDSSIPCSVLIPPGFGNAFQVMSKNAVYYYKLAYSGDYKDSDEQFTLKWNDRNININWPNDKPVLSDRDKI